MCGAGLGGRRQSHRVSETRADSSARESLGLSDGRLGPRLWVWVWAAIGREGRGAGRGHMAGVGVRKQTGDGEERGPRACRRRKEELGPAIGSRPARQVVKPFSGRQP